MRMSLGGVRDEAEIRGHRRTYIGALPGQIIQMMKKAGTKILSSCWTKWIRCRPISAAIHPPRCWKCSILNRTTCSWTIIWMWNTISHQVFFIATANVLHTIPPALQDRMEVIRLSGYTELEKLEIASASW